MSAVGAGTRDYILEVILVTIFREGVSCFGRGLCSPTAFLVNFFASLFFHTVLLTGKVNEFYGEDAMHILAIVWEKVWNN